MPPCEVTASGVAGGQHLTSGCVTGERSGAAEEEGQVCAQVPACGTAPCREPGLDHPERQKLASMVYEDILPGVGVSCLNFRSLWAPVLPTPRSREVVSAAQVTASPGAEEGAPLATAPASSPCCVPFVPSKSHVCRWPLRMTSGLGSWQQSQGLRWGVGKAGAPNSHREQREWKEPS